VATPVGSVFYMAASSADTAIGGSVTISSVAYHAPEGYLICNGGTILESGTFQGVNASLLQNLRNFLGETYGATGRLPDLRSNFAGYSAVPGTTGGSATATVVSHRHTGTTDSDGSHRHTSINSYFRFTDTGTLGKLERSSNIRRTQDQVETDFAGSHTHDFTTDFEGTTPVTNDANLPPFVGMLPVIKY